MAERHVIPHVPRCTYRRFAARAAPLALYEQLYGGDPIAFLYESLENDGARGRYSFVGGRPLWTLRCTGDACELRTGSESHTITDNPLQTLRELIATQPDIPPIAPFCGGAVGYLGYDSVRWIERIPCRHPDNVGIADAFFLFPREILCFDHVDKVVHVLLYQSSGQAERLAEITTALDHCEKKSPPEPSREQADPASSTDASNPAPSLSLTPNMTREQFHAMVARAKDYINAGDVFQVVLSQRFEFPLPCGPLDLYRALRVTNPSPYMYYLKLEGLHIAGSSPEMLVRTYGRRVSARPLAGTRRRGDTPEQDAALEAELRADPKERAEHVMLVDLGRNDLSRVCEYGSVQATDVLSVERHSRVMHLVSDVEGWLRSDRDAVDVFAAAFPAGTVSGAPKVRAMQIIDELEPTRRGVYAGAIGYFSLLGDVDLCIAIRSIVMKDGKGYIQAGAGIVADSIAENEYQETLNKAGALMKAVELAERTARR